MSEENKKRKIVPNIGMIVFFVIIIYLLGYIMTYLERDKLAIYEVAESDVKDTIEGTGFIIREEELVKTESSGYISPYVKDGSRVRVGGTVYTLDTTGKIQEFIEEIASEKESTDDEEQTSVVNDLQNFVSNYDDDRFLEVYNVKNDIARDLQNYTDTIMANNKEDYNEKYGEDSYSEQVSDQAGVISFQSDGMEKKTVETLKASDFDGVNNMEDLRTTKKVEEDTPAYRIVTSQEWNVVMKLSQDEYLKMKELESDGTKKVTIGFGKDDFTTKASFSCYAKDSSYYINLSFEQYVQNYLNQRYVWTRIILSEEDGLIVPSSSITYKEAYKIPQDFLITDSNKNYVYVLLNEEKQEVEQVEVDIIKTKNDNVYINSTGISVGDTLTDKNAKGQTSLEEKVKVRGVFIVNQGYAEFATVEVTDRSEDYCILSEEYSEVQMYDRIILHSDSIKENQIIY